MSSQSQSRIARFTIPRHVAKALNSFELTSFRFGPTTATDEVGKANRRDLLAEVKHRGMDKSFSLVVKPAAFGKSYVVNFGGVFEYFPDDVVTVSVNSFHSVVEEGEKQRYLLNAMGYDKTRPSLPMSTIEWKRYTDNPQTAKALRAAEKVYAQWKYRLENCVEDALMSRQELLLMADIEAETSVVRQKAAIERAIAELRGGKLRGIPWFGRGGDKTNVLVATFPKGSYVTQPKLLGEQQTIESDVERKRKIMQALGIFGSPGTTNFTTDCPFPSKRVSHKASHPSVPIAILPKGNASPGPSQNTASPAKKRRVPSPGVSATIHPVSRAPRARASTPPRHKAPAVRKAAPEVTHTTCTVEQWRQLAATANQENPFYAPQQPGFKPHGFVRRLLGEGKQGGGVLRIRWDKVDDEEKEDMRENDMDRVSPTHLRRATIGHVTKAYAKGRSQARAKA